MEHDLPLNTSDEKEMQEYEKHRMCFTDFYFKNQDVEISSQEIDLFNDSNDSKNNRHFQSI